jgi:hypothetical protein
MRENSLAARDGSWRVPGAGVEPLLIRVMQKCPGAGVEPLLIRVMQKCPGRGSNPHGLSTRAV